MLAEQKQLDIIMNLITRGTLEPVLKQLKAVYDGFESFKKVQGLPQKAINDAYKKQNRLSRASPRVYTGGEFAPTGANIPNTNVPAFRVTEQPKMQTKPGLNLSRGATRKLELIRNNAFGALSDPMEDVDKIMNQATSSLDKYQKKLDSVAKSRDKAHGAALEEDQKRINAANKVHGIALEEDRKRTEIANRTQGFALEDNLKRTERLNKAQVTATKNTAKFKMHWLGMMFAGMALQRAFMGVIQQSRIYTRVTQNMNREVGRNLDKSTVWNEALKTQANIMKAIPSDIIAIMYIVGGWVATLGQLMLAYGSVRSWILLNNLALAQQGTAVQIVSTKTALYNMTLGRLVNMYRASRVGGTASSQAMLSMGISAQVASVGTRVLTRSMMVLNTVMRLSPLIMIISLLALFSGALGDAEGPVQALTIAMGVLTAVLYLGLPIWLILGVIIGVIGFAVMALSDSTDALSGTFGDLGKNIDNTMDKGEKRVYDFTKKTGGWFNWLSLQGFMEPGVEKRSGDLLEGFGGGTGIEPDDTIVGQVTQLQNMLSVLDSVYAQVQEDYSLNRINESQYTRWTTAIDLARDRLGGLLQQIEDTKKPLPDFERALQDIQTEMTQSLPESAMLTSIVELLEAGKTHAMEFDKALNLMIGNINKNLPKPMGDKIEGILPQFLVKLGGPFAQFGYVLDDVRDKGISTGSSLLDSLLGPKTKAEEYAEVVGSRVTQALDFMGAVTGKTFGTASKLMGDNVTKALEVAYATRFDIGQAYRDMGRDSSFALDQTYFDLVAIESQTIRNTKAQEAYNAQIRAMQSAGMMGPAGTIWSLLGSRASGGPIDETGPYMMHKGEFVLSEDMLRNGIPTKTTISPSGSGGGKTVYLSQSNSFNFDDTKIQSPMDVYRLVDIIEDKLKGRALSI